MVNQTSGFGLVTVRGSVINQHGVNNQLRYIKEPEFINNQ